MVVTRSGRPQATIQATLAENSQQKVGDRRAPSSLPLLHRAAFRVVGRREGPAQQRDEKRRKGPEFVARCSVRPSAKPVASSSVLATVALRQSLAWNREVR